jgi:hypothetical protein
MYCVYAIIASNFVLLSMFGAPLHAYFSIFMWLLVLALCECVRRLGAGSLSAFELLTARMCANSILIYIRCVGSCVTTC